MRWFGLAVVLLTAEAVAHGRAAYSVSVAPHPSDGRVLVGATYGLLLSDSAGDFHWICDTAVGYVDTLDPRLVWATDGTLFAAIPGEKLVRSGDNGCTWTAIADFAATGAAFVLEDPSTPGTYWATSAKYGQTNALFKSTDGLSFAVTSLARTSMYFSSAAVAPSNSQRVYVSAWFNEPLEAWLFRSDDRAQSWTQLTPTLPGKSGFKVLGVHPTNPDIVFATVFDAQAQSLVLRSGDGGGTWTTLITTDDVIRSLWISSDGHTAYVASARKMYRSTDDGATFVAVLPWTTNACIGGRDGELFTCGREPANPFVIGKLSLADTNVITALARNENIKGPLQCPAGTSVGDICPGQWPLTAPLLGVAILPDGGSAPGGGEPVNPEAPAPCGCAAMPLPGLLAVLALGFASRRTR